MARGESVVQGNIEFCGDRGVGSAEVVVAGDDEPMPADRAGGCFPVREVDGHRGRGIVLVTGCADGQVPVCCRFGERHDFSCSLLGIFDPMTCGGQLGVSGDFQVVAERF